MSDDDARIAEIRARHVAFDFGMAHPDSGQWISRVSCKGCHRPWPCEQSVLGGRLDTDRARLEGLQIAFRNVSDKAAQLGRALETATRSVDDWREAWEQTHIELEQAEASRDALASRLAAAEATLSPCTLALEYRDGVTCREERDRGVCLNHRVIQGLRVHAVTADRLELENRALRRQVRASYGIIHDGLHGGKPTDPEHQEACEMPSCRNARAVLAGSREQSAGDGA